MATTDAYAQGGLALASVTETEFVHGPQVDSDIVLEWDFDNDGDFDGTHENVTADLYDLDATTGRDWPSQLQGKAGPGRLQARLRNDDDKYSYFNTASPLNQLGNTLDSGRKIRVRTEGTTDVDPVLLRRDRFDGALAAVTTDETGAAWTHRTAATFVVLADTAAATSEGVEHLMTLDAGVADYYVQATTSVVGGHVKVSAGFQEQNELRLIYRWQDDSNYSYVSILTNDNGQQTAGEVVDIVAGTPASLVGPFAFVGGDGVSAAVGDHRQKITVGVAVTGTSGSLYLEGALSATFTAIQTDETEIGLYALWGDGNTRPAWTELHVWDRVTSNVEGVIWTGYVTDVVPDADPGAPKTVTVTAEGVLAQAAEATVVPTAFAGSMRTGTVIGDVLQSAGLLHPPGVIDRGDIDAGSSAAVSIKALAHMRKAEEVEFGFLHEAPEGWLNFQDRSYRTSLSVSATFSDVPGAQYSYRGFELLQWKRELINRVSAGISRGPADLVVVGGGTDAGTASGVARSISFTMPALSDGDLFVVMITSTIADDNENWLVPIFWVRNRDTGASSSKRTQVYTHIGAASEAASTVTFYNDTAAAGGSYILRYYQIRNWYGSHDGIEVGEWSTGEAFAGADPAVILPGWGDTNPTAFVAQRCGVSTGGAGAITDPTFPLGYVNSFDIFHNGAANIHDCGMLLCSKLDMTSVEDPSTFTGFSGLQNAETSVIAVRGFNGSPPEPNGRYRVTVDDVESQRRHNAVSSYDGTDMWRNEDDAQDWCDLMLATYSTPRPIIRFSFPATLSASYRYQAYARRLSDKVRVVATDGTGMGINGDFHIENINHRWTSAGKQWETTWELSPA